MLIESIRSYLALRRSAGFKLRTVEYKLRSFERFARRRGDTFVRAKTAIAWAARAPSPEQRRDLLGSVNLFARFARAEDLRHELAPLETFPGRARERAVPFIFTPKEVAALVAEAAKFGPKGSLRPHTLSTLLALLAATGLRIGEALNLRLRDISADGLVIRETKFRKSRLVPLHKTAAAGMERYLRRRMQIHTAHDHVFISLTGNRLNHQQVFRPFRRMVDERLRLPLGRSKRRPHIHDLRHTFAVRALEASGRDRVWEHMLALSTYMGHADVADTYWYLEATPQLLHRIAAETERFVKGGAQ